MIGVLDQVQVFDQQIATAGAVAQQRLDLLRGGRINLTPLGGRFRPFAPQTRMFERANLMHVMTHWRFPLSLDHAILKAGMPDAKRKSPTPRRGPCALSRTGNLLSHKQENEQK